VAYLEVRPIVFVLRLSVHGHDDPLEDFVGLWLPFIDVEFEEGFHVDAVGDLHSAPAVGEVQLLRFCDFLPELPLVIGALVSCLILSDGSLDGFWLSSQLNDIGATSWILLSHSARLAAAFALISFRLYSASFNFWVWIWEGLPVSLKILCLRSKFRCRASGRRGRRPWAAPLMERARFRRDPWGIFLQLPFKYDRTVWSTYKGRL